MGIITLEDVLEMLLQEQIYDEMDSKQRSAHRLAIVVCRRWKKYAKKCKYDRLLKEQQQNATELLHNIEDAMNPNESTSLLYKR